GAGCSGVSVTACPHCLHLDGDRKPPRALSSGPPVDCPGGRRPRRAARGAARRAPVAPERVGGPWGASGSALFVGPGGAPGRDPLSRCTGVAEQPPDLLRLG